MIIEPDPLTPFDVPAAANFSLRFRTSFTAQQVTDATRRVFLFSPGGGVTEYAAAASSSDMLLSVTPSMLSPGRWTFRPEIVVGGLVYAWPEAGTMDVIAPGQSRAGSGC